MPYTVLEEIPVAKGYTVLEELPSEDEGFEAPLTPKEEARLQTPLDRPSRSFIERQRMLAKGLEDPLNIIPTFGLVPDNVNLTQEASRMVGGALHKLGQATGEAAKQVMRGEKSPIQAFADIGGAKTEPLGPNDPLLTHIVTGAAEAAPLVAGGMALQAAGVPAPLAFGAPMAAETYARTGDPLAALKSGAVGAVLPSVARSGAAGGELLAQRAAARLGVGETALKAAETTGRIVGSQSLMNGLMIASQAPELAQLAASDPDAFRNEILKTVGISLAFEVPHLSTNVRAALAKDRVDQYFKDPEYKRTIDNALATQQAPSRTLPDGVTPIPPAELAAARSDYDAKRAERMGVSLVQPVETAKVVQDGFQHGLPRTASTVAKVAVEPVAKPSPPVVPETPAQTYIPILGEIRQAGADTVRKIQELFPNADLSREEARQLRNLAFPKDEPVQTVKESLTTEPTVKAPAVVPVVETKPLSAVPPEQSGLGAGAATTPSPEPLKVTAPAQPMSSTPTTAPPIEQGRVVPEAKEGEVSVRVEPPLAEPPKTEAVATEPLATAFSPEALQTDPGATLGITPSGLSVPASTIDNLVKKVRQQLSVSGKMPREVHELQTQMESSMRAADFDLRMAERDFMREVSQTYGLGPVARLGGGTRRIPPADVQLMDEYLHGRLTPDQANRIPQNIRGQLDNMRAGIEGWSNKTIATLEEQLSRLDPESAKAKMLNDRIENIRSNMDVYVHRSYKFFDKNTPAPDWYAKLPAKVRSDAETYVRDNMNLAPEEAQSNLLRWLSDLRDESSFRQGGRVGSKDLTMFLQRKAIPQELRAVLGEYRSPLVNYAKSVSKMSQFVAKQKFLDEVRRKGMGSFLFEEGTEPPGFNARIAPEGSESMSPLSGLRTSQDIADAFRDLDRPIGTGNTVWDGAVRGYLTLNAWTKFANTAQSLMTHSRNIISRVPMAIQAGHWNVLHVPQAMKLIYQDFAGSNKTWRPFLNRLYKLGVIGDTSRSTELRNILKDAAFQDVAPAELSSWSLMRALKTGLVKIPGDIYRLTDELGNIYGFLNERAIQKRIHPDWTDAKLDAEAATVIRDLYPTYSEAPKIVQTFRKNILVGPFVNFPYQVFRNAVNGVVRSAKEIQSENPVERQVGWKRLGSQLLAASTPLAMMELSKQMLGITAQEENDLRRFLPEYDKNSTLIFTGRDPKTGELSYVNASRLVPSTYITDIANPVILAARTGGDLVKAVGDGIKEAFRPFYNEQMLLKATREAYNGVTDTGRKLFNKTDSDWTQTTKRIAHVITALEPGTLQRAQKRIIPALRDEQPRFGRKLEPMREIAREVTGIATEKFNFKTALGFKVRSFVDMSNEAEDHFRRIATGRSKVSEQELIDAYRESDRRRIAVWQEMRDDYLAAIRRGVSVNEGKSIMRARGMSKADAESIANGRYKPMEVSDQVRKRAKEIGRALPYNATFRESVRTPSKP